MAPHFCNEKFASLKVFTKRYACEKFDTNGVICLLPTLKRGLGKLIHARNSCFKSKRALPSGKQKIVLLYKSANYRRAENYVYELLPQMWVIFYFTFVKGVIILHIFTLHMRRQ